MPNGGVAKAFALDFTPPHLFVVVVHCCYNLFRTFAGIQLALLGALTPILPTEPFADLSAPVVTGGALTPVKPMEPFAGLSGPVVTGSKVCTLWATDVAAVAVASHTAKAPRTGLRCAVCVRCFVRAPTTLPSDDWGVRLAWRNERSYCRTDSGHEAGWPWWGRRADSEDETNMSRLSPRRNLRLRLVGDNLEEALLLSWRRPRRRIWPYERLRDRRRLSS